MLKIQILPSFSILQRLFSKAIEGKWQPFAKTTVITGITIITRPFGKTLKLSRFQLSKGSLYLKTSLKIGLGMCNGNFCCILV